MIRPIDIIQYILVRLITSFLLCFSLETALKAGRFLGRIYYFLDKKHQRRGYQHLERVYKDRKTPKEIKKLLIKVFEHFGMVLTETVFLPRKITLNTYSRYVSIKGLDRLDNALKKGKGIIFVGAHFGNWDLTGHLLPLLGYPLSSVARAMDNPLIDTYLNYFRKYRGQEIIYRKSALKGMMRALKNNRILGIVSDQDARAAGVFVDFFGMKSSTIRAPAVLNIKTEAPLILFHCYRSQPDKFKYIFSIEPPLEIELSNDPTNDIIRITQTFTRRIEDLIRQYPEQWLWLHRRWKTRLSDQPNLSNGPSVLAPSGNTISN